MAADSSSEESEPKSEKAIEKKRVSFLYSLFAASAVMLVTAPQTSSAKKVNARSLL
jgi:hypothetical protein